MSKTLVQAFTQSLTPFVLLSIGLFLIFHAVTRSSRKRQTLFTEPLAAFSYLLLPTTFLFGILVLGGALPHASWWGKILKTIIGIEVIWALLSLFKSIFLRRSAQHESAVRLPVLFLDVLRMTLVLLGSAIVVATVWDHDLTKFLTTLGIGSIVLGLALQETLGNFFSGIALFFEHPFKNGDWVKIGDREGEIIEANWRSVRLRDRCNNMVVIPNSVLGRERIENFNQPTSTCGLLLRVGFSYNDAPSKVKAALLEVISTCPRVLKVPVPSIRTKDFGDFSVTYEIKYFINQYAQLPEIEEEIRTRIWYAARRHKLTIPYPTQISFETKIPFQPEADRAAEIREMLTKIPLFQPLLPEELTALSGEVRFQEYTDGEFVVEQGAQGDSMFVVCRGSALVSIKDGLGVARQVKELGPGEVFGEMALLTGEARSATVKAKGDLELLVVDKQALNTHFTARPALLNLVAEVASHRRTHLEIIRTAPSESQPKSALDGNIALLTRIRCFFGFSAGNQV